jgi:hypothetical protein
LHRVFSTGKLVRKPSPAMGATDVTRTGCVDGSAEFSHTTRRQRGHIYSLEGDRFLIDGTRSGARVLDARRDECYPAQAGLRLPARAAAPGLAAPDTRGRRGSYARFRSSPSPRTFLSNPFFTR